MIETLQKTRALIEQGWCQHWHRRHRWDVGTEYCLAAALGQVCQADFPTHDSAFALLLGICRQRGFIGIVSFNDHPMTTKQDVLALLDAAIHTEQVRQEVEAAAREHKEEK